MRFSTVFSVLSCGAMALAAAVSPAALVSRSNDEVAAVLNTCETRLDAAFVKLDACKTANCTTTIVGTVVGIIDDTKTAVSSVNGTANTVLGQGVADVVVKVSGKLDSHKTACNGLCGDLAVYADVDVSVSALLNQLEICAPGILKIVVKLVTSVVATLKALGLTAILTALGLN